MKYTKCRLLMVHSCAIGFIGRDIKAEALPYYSNFSN